jgi:hypothetical protein
VPTDWVRIEIQHRGSLKQRTKRRRSAGLHI